MQFVILTSFLSFYGCKRVSHRLDSGSVSILCAGILEDRGTSYEHISTSLKLKSKNIKVLKNNHYTNKVEKCMQ